MKAPEVIDLIPDQYLTFLSAQTQVDYKLQKLSGKLMFKLLVYSLLAAERNNLRTMEAVFSSYAFQAFAHIGPGVHTRFNSIRDWSYPGRFFWKAVLLLL